MNDARIAAIFNDAISFALDVADDGLLFLRLWREGDWLTLVSEFPDYTIPAELLNPIHVKSMN
jgi:hypothetical protein